MTAGDAEYEYAKQQLLREAREAVEDRSFRFSRPSVNLRFFSRTLASVQTANRHIEKTEPEPKRKRDRDEKRDKKSKKKHSEKKKHKKEKRDKEHKKDSKKKKRDKKSKEASR